MVVVTFVIVLVVVVVIVLAFIFVVVVVVTVLVVFVSESDYVLTKTYRQNELLKGRFLNGSLGSVPGRISDTLKYDRLLFT